MIFNKTKKGVWPALALLLVLVGTPLGAAFAQGLTGQISGSIFDAQGASVPNATVEVTNVETARVVTLTTDDQGNFTAPQLLPGVYTITVTAGGFKKFERSGIPVTANERVPVGRLTLEVGDVSQTVTITAEQTFVKTESAERAGLIDEQQIQSIALKGRDYMGLSNCCRGSSTRPTGKRRGGTTLSASASTGAGLGRSI